MADGMSGQQDRRRRIHLVFFDAGGGHRNAATALQVQIERQGLPLEVSLVNLQEVLDPLDILRKLTGIRIQDMYNKMLRNGWTLGSPQLMRVLQLVVRTYHGPSVRVLEKFWKEHPPDMVVSLVPHFNRALRESFEKAFPGQALRHGSDRPGGLSEAFLDRERIAIHRLRNRARRRTGPRARASRWHRLPDFRDDPASALLRDRRGGPGCGAKEARPRSGSADRHCPIRGIRHLEDAGHSAADQPVVLAGAAHPDLRAE